MNRTYCRTVKAGAVRTGRYFWPVCLVVSLWFPATGVVATGEVATGEVAAGEVATGEDTSGGARRPEVVIETSLGDIEVELFADKAPETVANFLSYVDSGAYDGVIFHRVIAGFMIQTGGHYADMEEVAAGEVGAGEVAAGEVVARAPVVNEADNGLHNVRGTLAMARTSAIDSATRQFFINVVDDPWLDHSEESCTREDEKAWMDAMARGLYRPKTCKTFGYAVFGRVVSGMDVVDAIEVVETGHVKGYDDVPLKPVIVTTIRRVQEAQGDSVAG